MQITKVEIRNIKNHAEVEFSFQPGVIAICGPNGSGKTTILEAIAWALFDHLDYKRDDFIKRGAKRGQVVVGFISNQDQREYIVTRDTGGGYFVYDPTTKTRLVEQKNQVVPWLRQHIGVEPGTDLSALFKTTIGVPQGTFTYDFTQSPASRKSVFDQILKVEEYREASDNLRDTLRLIESRITEADQRLAEAEGELKVYDETRRDFEAVEQQLASMVTEQASADAARDRAVGEIARMSDLQKKSEAQRGVIERLRVKCSLTKGSLSTSREGAEQSRAASLIVEAARAGYEKYLAASGRLSELERRREGRDALRNRMSMIERELIEARSQAMRGAERLAEVASARGELERLTAQVQEQETIERLIGELREQRVELQGLQRAQTVIDRELERLRDRDTDLARRLEIAEAAREKAALSEKHEYERARLDEEIRLKERALGQFQLKQDHLKTLGKESRRLSRELEKTKNEAARLGPLAAQASRLGETESSQQSETERLAHLRAEVSRDREMISALESGGLCPLLSERCLNLKPGESLDSRFRAGLDAREDEIVMLQIVLDGLADEVRRARAASAETARLPHLNAEAIRLAQELAAQATLTAKVEAEIALGEGVSDQQIEQLKSVRAGLEKLWREAREAERVFGQAELLRREIEAGKSEGEVKRRERDELNAQMDQLVDLEARLGSAEERLRALNDPRSRAAACRQTIAREVEWKTEAEKIERRVSEIEESFELLNVGLRDYAALDSDLAGVSQSRAAAERDYQAFIANEKIAATLAAREQEVVALSAELHEIERSLSGAEQALTDLESRYDADEHRRAQADLDHWRERATQITAQLKHTRETFSRLQTQLARLEGVRELRRGQLAEKGRAQRLRETADFIRDILQKAAPYITESYLFSISSEANQLYREITGRYDVTLRWTKEYEITIEEEGRERPFLNLSGGEQMAAALAVRLALLKELSEINLAFFDEPTTNMDEERRRNLAQQIGRIRDFQQLFIISHDDSFEEFTEQIISLGERS